jgi:hypothetical protein
MSALFMNPIVSRIDLKRNIIDDFISSIHRFFRDTYVGIKKETKDEKKEGEEDSESCALSWLDMMIRWLMVGYEVV